MGVTTDLKEGKLEHQKCVCVWMSWMYTDRPRTMAIQNTLQMYSLEERIQACKDEWHNHILRMDFSRPKVT
jgi:hypothetical protein